MSRKKKIRRLVKAQRAADRAVAKAWRRRAKLSGAALEGAVRGRSLVKGAQADPFDAFLARKAAGGDASARELLQKRAADGDPRYRAYLERVAKTAQSGEVRSAASDVLARLEDGSPAPSPQHFRWTAW